jgi:capsular exopolysaccharide synthesis family protein
MLRTIPQKERQLLEITRQQSIKNDIYTFLLQKREDAALSFASAVSDSRLVDKAQSGLYPVSPNRTFVYAVALLFGLGLPIGFLSVKEFFNQTIQSTSDISAVTSFAILGEIDHDRTKKTFVIGNGETSYVAEQIRQIRTSLSYLGVNKQKNKILVTSSAQGEGKTFVATNLAISLALTDKKVLLIELDLRRPNLGGVFNLRSDFGISDYLMKLSTAEQIIYRTEVSPNLFLIPCGEIPQNPSELISNGRLDELLQTVEKSYDYIIIETAPVGPVTDAYIISKLCDSTLFIVRQDKTLKEDLKKLETNLRIRSLSNVALVFNGVRPIGFQRQGYEYYKEK